MVTIYSITASLKNELGHFFEYHLAFSKAAKMNNFNYDQIIFSFKFQYKQICDYAIVHNNI